MEQNYNFDGLDEKGLVYVKSISSSELPIDVQQEILDDASKLVNRDGVLVYMTCSLLKAENTDQIDAFLLRNSDWKVIFQESFPVSDSGDGFFVTHFKMSS